MSGNLKLLEKLTEDLANQKETNSGLDCIYESAFENAEIAMALVDGQGKWVKVNKAMNQLVGYYNKDLAFSTPESLVDVREEISQIESCENSNFKVNRVITRKDGSSVLVSVNASKCSHSPSEPPYFVFQFKPQNT